MPLKTRIVPILQWNGISAVKSKKFQRPHRAVGSMMQNISVMQERDIDELILLDVNATIEQRKPLFEEIKEYTSMLYCPVTVGGGISTLDDIEKLLKAGADKVCIGKEIFNFKFIKEASQKFGSQCIVGSIDADAYNYVYRSYDYVTGKDRMFPVKMALEILQEHGVGEVLLTSVANDGTLNGYDMELVEDAQMANIKIPIIINGGCGNPDHMSEALELGVHAVAASSLFLFTEYTPKDCAEYLKKCGYETRI